jgi:hypothetical protein
LDEIEFYEDLILLIDFVVSNVKLGTGRSGVQIRVGEGARFSAPFQTGHGAPFSKIGTGSFYL